MFFDQNFNILYPIVSKNQIDNGKRHEKVSHLFLCFLHVRLFSENTRGNEDMKAQKKEPDS